MIKFNDAIRSINLFSHISDEEIEIIKEISHFSKYEAETIL